MEVVEIAGLCYRAAGMKRDQGDGYASYRRADQLFHVVDNRDLRAPYAFGHVESVARFTLALQGSGVPAVAARGPQSCTVGRRAEPSLTLVLPVRHARAAVDHRRRRLRHRNRCLTLISVFDGPGLHDRAGLSGHRATSQCIVGLRSWQLFSKT